MLWYRYQCRCCGAGARVPPAGRRRDTAGRARRRRRAAEGAWRRKGRWKRAVEGGGRPASSVGGAAVAAHGQEAERWVGALPAAAARAGSPRRLLMGKRRGREAGRRSGRPGLTVVPCPGSFTPARWSPSAAQSCGRRPSRPRWRSSWPRPSWPAPASWLVSSWDGPGC